MKAYIAAVKRGYCLTCKCMHCRDHNPISKRIKNKIARAVLKHLLRKEVDQ